MKKPYQIESQRAVKRLEEMAAEGNPAVQLVLPMAEAMGWLRQGVGELIRQAGVQIIGLVMEEEVRELVGERSQPQAERKANRWGSERGYCVVMGQKLPIERPRVRSTEDREVRLGSYELFHRGEPLTETVWEKLMLGLSTRKYGQAVRQFTEAYGLEKSAVSEHFIEASRAKLKQLMERRLDKMRFCALLIDATPFEGQQMVAVLGIGQDGRKTILGIRQGATENATVVGELLGDVAERGLDFTATRLYVLDGAKALSAAVKTHAGESALIQRCQVHKRRNVLDHLPEDQKPLVAQKLNAAYSMEDYEAAKLALHKLHRELMDFNPSAARSLAEGMEETLTVHRLQVPPQLRQTLASTNVIESAFSVVEKVCANVKRWHPGDQRERYFQRKVGRSRTREGMMLINNRDVMSIVMPDRSPAHQQHALVLRKKDKTWRVLPIPSGQFEWQRSFGKFLAVIEAHVKGSQISESAGRAEWRKDESRLGPSTQTRLDETDIAFPGRLYLYNVETDRVYAIATKQGDSEVLLVQNNIVYYRVSNRLYSATLTESEVGSAMLLATDDVIRDVHWAFIK